jgi:hypothetical protein
MLTLSNYSKTPGPRYKSEGPYSAEEYLETILVPALTQSINNGKSLYFELNNVQSLPACFMDEVSRGLIETFGIKNIDNYLIITSDRSDFHRQFMSYIQKYKRQNE